MGRLIAFAVYRPVSVHAPLDSGTPSLLPFKSPLKIAITAMADPASNPKEVAGLLGMTTTMLCANLNGDGWLKEFGQFA